MRARQLLILAGLIAFTVAGASAGGQTPSYRGKVFLGLGTRGVRLPRDERYASTHGLEVMRVAAGSSAEKAGLRVGDTIVSVDGTAWTSERIRLSRSFGKAGNKSRPGDIARFQILRAAPGDPNGPKELLELDVVLLPYPFTEPEMPRSPANDALRPDLKHAHPAYENLCRQLIAACGYKADTLDLLERLRRCEEFPDPHRLPIVCYVHRDPFKLEAVTRELAAPLLTGAGGVASLGRSLDLVEHILLRFGTPRDAPAGIEPAEGIPTFAGKDLDGHLDYVEAVLARADAHQKRAFSAMTQPDIKFILKHRHGMLDAYVTYRMLSYDTDAARQRASAKLIRIASKVNIAALLDQARPAALLVAPDFTASLRRAAEASGKPLDKPVIAQRNTPYGGVLVAGRGRTRYQGKDYAAIYDLGGDDVYANNCAASIPGAIPTAVIVDYAGDDAYESTRLFRQGCGDMGVGLLVDLQGNDNYIGSRYTQGVGFMGVGVLCDEAGDDTYRGIAFHQGVGHFGAGILLDGSGRDRYESHDTSQGVGLPGGCGILCDGGAEGDSYYCKGWKPSGYGTSGVFKGCSQGIGIGYRPYASGGVGMLLDRGGEDRFEAGNFSQGGGYFYAFGILYNAGAEDDVYIGSRYAQGFCAHQAAGAFIEEGGNDRYVTRYAVAQGLSWDETSVLFLDAGGDDRYEGGSFSQGASAMNGFVMFIDAGGQDTYLYCDQARAGGNRYHGGKSLSFFLDLGGDPDQYPSKPNNAIVKGGENSIFADLPGSVEDALEDDAWQSLLKRPEKAP